MLLVIEISGYMDRTEERNHMKLLHVDCDSLHYQSVHRAVIQRYSRYLFMYGDN
jgi:hypothetical protein